MYIKYLIFSICQLFCMLICYLTNPLSDLKTEREELVAEYTRKRGEI